MDLRSLEDEELVEMAQTAAEGDLRAYDRLVERHQHKVLTNCRHLTRSPDDAEDLAQEVFVKAFFALPRFEGRSAFGTWVGRIKVNHCLNFLRKREGKTHVDVEDEAVHAAPELHVQPRAQRRVEAMDERARIREVLDSMSDTLRIPLLLRDLDEMSYQEIADELGIGISATKMRIKRAREEFRARYGEILAEQDA